LFVWAPHARSLELELGGKRLPMRERGRGYWDADSPELRHDADYQLFVDGEGPFPDPRSASQPQGPFGPSRVVDHARFAWTDAAFRAPPLAAGVIYEMHAGTFTAEGTFDAAIERLAHLADLGVTHVEVMPIASFAGNRGWGYDGVDLFAPQQSYGGPEAFKRFVDACHGRGLAVILDVVYNHLGPTGNFLGKFGPYFTDVYKTPWGAAVNLDDRGCDEVRRFFADNALMWLRDYHVDGLRLDAVHAYQDHSSVTFLEQLSGEVAALSRETGRPYCLIAESDYNDPRMVRSLEAGGLGMDAQWSDDFHHALHALLTGERQEYYEDFGSLAALAQTLTGVFYLDGGRYSEFRRKTHGRPAGDTARWRFLAYAQNHDQIGNRAQGDRLAGKLSIERLKIAAALVLTSPFLPMLFQGEEWGSRTPFLFFTDFADATLAAAVREGRRREVGQTDDPQAPATFERCKLDWRDLETDGARELLAWHRQLIALRREVPPAGRTEVSFDEERGYLLARTGGLAVAINLGQAPAAVALPPAHQPWTLALASGKGVTLETIPPESVGVFRAT
jgi:maltooligosyltrehalose trehalohydrolase